MIEHADAIASRLIAQVRKGELEKIDIDLVRQRISDHYAENKIVLSPNDQEYVELRILRKVIDKIC